MMTVCSEYGAVLQDLVAVLLQTDAAQRPSAEQVLRVPALQRQVKATYKRCVSHRLERRRQRALSREVASPGGPFGEQVLRALQTADHFSHCDAWHVTLRGCSSGEVYYVPCICSHARCAA